VKLSTDLTRRTASLSTRQRRRWDCISEWRRRLGK